MSYLDNFNVERIDSIPEVKQQLRNLRRAIDNKEVGTYTPPSTGIPKTDLSQEVQNSLLKAENAYQKPTTGIPASDLASGVQTSLGKADTALQTIKTVNGQSLVGSGDIEILEPGTIETLVIDDTPEADSNNLVKSGGVAREIVWDVTARNSNATFASLSALLSDANLATLIPTTIRRGGMQIRFVHSNDNNYVQYRLMATSFSTIESDWESVETIKDSLSASRKFNDSEIQSGYWTTVNGIYNAYTQTYVCTKNYITRDIREIRTHNGVKIMLVAWDENDTYVGTWFGNGFVKQFDANYVTRVIDLSYFYYNYPNYRFRINVTNVSSETVDVNTFLNKTTLTYITAAVPDSIADTCLEANLSFGKVLSTDIWSNATITGTGVFNVLQANESLFGKRLATKPYMRFFSPVTIKPKQGYVMSVTRYNADYSFYDQFSAWSTSPYTFSRNDLYYRITIKASNESVISGQNVGNYLVASVDEGTPSDRLLAEYSNVKTVNHRGYNVVAPENTIPAYEMSAKLGYKYVETDVLFTSDGVPVLMHDDTINRTCCMASDGSAISGTINISDIPYADLISLYDACTPSQYAKWHGTKVPTFAEFMSCCKKKNLHPWIELKWTHTYTQSEIQQIISTIRQYGMEENVSIISFSYDALSLVAQQWDSVELGLNGTVENAKLLRTGKNRVFMIYNQSTDYSDAVEEGFQVCVYTVDTAAQLAALSNPAFDSILTNNLSVSEVYNTLNLT